MQRHMILPTLSEWCAQLRRYGYIGAAQEIEELCRERPGLAADTIRAAIDAAMVGAVERSLAEHDGLSWPAEGYHRKARTALAAAGCLLASGD